MFARAVTKSHCGQGASAHAMAMSVPLEVLRLMSRTGWPSQFDGTTTNFALFCAICTPPSFDSSKYHT